ncbi:MULTISPECIES: fatty acid desaturase [Bordetella]|uniref:Fatty acid desaturase n=3 Tax=Bordetella TaxID=517 RepID=K0MAC1_BORPB|nr:MULTISPECIES: fatty acid desaturase [Bordetella]SHS03622.1 Fatty acid desaturase [Mycobacteroides abscessus subsp. abscessus]AWP73027.1 fatty acid desaturase [Bordetella bronchiseptica]AWP77837.1 fatty acid desaturase [Bordetella bronchiseptica]AZW19829.1 fatty acid desaturase [Bordetella bronchiseptica]KCV35314.1 stearoyl-CoA 9-desaturase [Bordetella bronchiseptica 00-P-2796]
MVRPAEWLRHRRDWQSILYLAALPALAAWQWVHGWHWALYAPMLFLTLGVGVIHHNHAHRRMWRPRWLNRLTDFWLTLLQGHPTFVFHAAHNANHHRYKHGPRDVARTYRFGGDTNHLAGYLLHPLQAVVVLYPLFLASLRRLRSRRPGVWRYCLRQYAAWLGLWGGLLALDPGKAFWLVIVPQLHGLHWLLATNYLQHAHADGGPGRHAALSYARNFEGWVNPLLFNIGLHTAHHENPRAHWSELRALHWQHYRDRVPSRLNERGLAPYMARVFVLGLFSRRCRTHTLMRP